MPFGSHWLYSHFSLVLHSTQWPSTSLWSHRDYSHTYVCARLSTRLGRAFKLIFALQIDWFLLFFCFLMIDNFCCCFLASWQFFTACKEGCSDSGMEVTSLCTELGSAPSQWRYEFFQMIFFFLKHKKSKTREPRGHTLLNDRGGGTKPFAEIAENDKEIVSQK